MLLPFFLEGLGSLGRSLVCDMSTKSDNVPRYTLVIARRTNLELTSTWSINYVSRIERAQNVSHSIGLCHHTRTMHFLQFRKILHRVSISNLKCWEMVRWQKKLLLLSTVFPFHVIGKVQLSIAQLRIWARLGGLPIIGWWIGVVAGQVRQGPLYFTEYR